MSISPYFAGYLACAAYGGRRVPLSATRPDIYNAGPLAQAAYLEGMADSIRDSEPRRPYHRVSRAHPPWRLI